MEGRHGCVALLFSTNRPGGGAGWRETGMLLWRRVPIVLALLAGGVALLSLALTASAAPLATTRSYPGSLDCTTTLQACIDVSAAGDQINIAANTYITSITLNKAVSLVGAN